MNDTFGIIRHFSTVRGNRGDDAMQNVHSDNTRVFVLVVAHVLEQIRFLFWIHWKEICSQR